MRISRLHWFFLLFLCSVCGVLNANDNAKFLLAIGADNASEIAASLDQVTDIDQQTSSGKTALMAAAKVGDQQLVEQLLKRGASPGTSSNNGGTALMFAAISGNTAIIRRLIDLGAEVNKQGSNGWGALMVAVAKGHRDAVRVLIEQGADVNARDVYGWTPLHRACFEVRDNVVALLISARDIAIDPLDDQGATPLHHAAGKGSIEIVRFLLRAGADKTISDASGRTPSAYAQMKKYDTVAALLTVEG